MTVVRYGFLVILAAALIGCGRTIERDGPPSSGISIPEHVPDAVPTVEPKSKYGNPKSYVVFGKRYYTLDSSGGYQQRGIASWYGKKFHGRRTSSGEPYDMFAMTAAHKTLPLPTYAEVTNLENGRTVIVKINDRGPFHEDRIIDLSYSAAKRLEFLGNGTATVRVVAIDPLTWNTNDGGTSAPVAHTSSTEDPALESEMAAESEVSHTTEEGESLFLQVAAFSVRANAEQIRAEIHGLSEGPTRVSKAVRGGKTVYRVQVGPLGSVAEADRLIGLLDEAGFPGLYLVLE